ncbi:MAG: UDP-glucose 4-epimerase GalE [Bacteroidota bacterium]
MKKVLVTGGMGYIGSHTVVELHNSGYEAIIVDNLSNSHPSMLKRLEDIMGVTPEFYQKDLKDLESLREVFDEHDISSVIHFAASKAVGESVNKPLLYYKNNLLGTINLLELMETYQVSSIIFSSSCTVYGEPDKLPVTENSAIKPANSPYGNTKQVCEEIIKDAITSNDSLQAISLRYFNPIGAHNSGKIGEFPSGIPNNLMPYLLEVASGKLEQLSVFGADYDTPDGSCIRDYIHVVDLAKAHVVSLQRLLQNKAKEKYEVFNLGTGTGYSVLDIITTFEKTIGKKVNYKVVDRRPGDVEKIYADTSFANHELGWKAKLGLQEMLQSSWAWQQRLMEET